jgi:hypothetical protein
VAKDREDIELAFNVELETRKAMRAISGIDRQLRKTVTQKLQIKAFDSKAIRAFSRELAHSKRILRDVSFSMSPRTRSKFQKDFKDMGLAYKGLTSIVTREKQKITALERRMNKEQDEALKKALADQLELEKKASAKSIKQARKAYDTKRGALSKKLVSSGASAEIERRGQQARQAKEFIEGIKSHKTGAELAEGFKDAVSAMSGKDIFGLGKAGMKMSGSILKGLAKGSMAKGAGVSAKGAEMGGLTGSALKGIGGAMKSIGPLLGSLSKLGPMLGMVGGAMFALVKLFLDADAAVKEMNKTVLEGGATWDTYAAQGRNVDLGMMNLDESLKRLRGETNDLKMNFSMGTTAKDHQQVINTLQREGVTLQQLTVGFEKYTDISKQAIVYSRLFGVSVDEMAQMQAEMMTQMGTGLDGLNKEFDSIGRAAEESGIAQNKFFAMLRGVSSDLALYGVRIGETTKMLGQLGKVMSPRSADKFLKTFAQGFKGKSIQDRLKSMLLGGPGAVKAVQSSIGEQITDLVKQVQESVPGLDAESAKAMLSGKSVGGQSLRKLEKSGKIQGAGALIESFQKLSMSAKQAKQGSYGAAQASENLGGFGAYKAVKAGLRLSGKGSFEEASTSGVGSHQAAILASGGEEQLEANIAIERAIKQQKNDLIGAIDDPAGNDDLIAILTKMGKITDSSSIDQRKAAVEAMTEDELWRSLDQANAKKSQTQMEKDSEAMRQMGAEQGTRTQSMLERLDMIFDALYNAIYDVLVGMWESFPWVKGGLKSEVFKSKNMDVKKAWSNSGGDENKFRGNLAGSDTAKKIDALLHSKDPAQANAKEAQGKYIMAMMKDFSVSGNTQKDLGDAAKAVGISAKQVYDMQSQLVAGGDVASAVDAGKLSEDQKSDLLSKMGLWFTSAKGSALLQGNSTQYLGGTKTPGAPGPSGPTSGQQAASAKSENPGTGGAAVSAAPTSPTQTSTPASSFFGATAPDEKKATEAVMDSIDFTGDATVNSLQDLWKAMRVKGIKLDKTQLSGDIQDSIHRGTQESLFEYALYTSTNPADTLNKMKASGFTGMNTLTKGFEDQQSKRASDGSATLVPHADGGVVTGISGGFANVNPAPGEGLTSIGRGERIVPAGGGKGEGEVHLHVDGLGGADLANFLKGQIARGIHEYKRREKFS